MTHPPELPPSPSRPAFRAAGPAHPQPGPQGPGTPRVPCRSAIGAAHHSSEQSLNSQAKHLAHLATQALLDEANLTPKPGLVDRRSSGAHHDLTLPLLLRSAHLLEPYFQQMAEAAQTLPPSQTLRERLAQIGRQAEHHMLAATNGINTHRGAIWSLGLLVAAATLHLTTDPGNPRLASETWASTDSPDHHAICNLAGQIARYPDRHAPTSPTHGTEAHRKFGATGARGEATSAFPHLRLHALPALATARALSFPEPLARLHILLTLIAVLPDTCLLHRGGLPALAAAQHGARQTLAAGLQTPPGQRSFRALDRTLLRLWASPGGSADLLAATLFLDSLRSPSPR